MGLLPQKLSGKLRQILIKTQDAHVQVIQDSALKPIECNIKRAEILREFFEKLPRLGFD